MFEEFCYEHLLQPGMQYPTVSFRREAGGTTRGMLVCIFDGKLIPVSFPDMKQLEQFHREVEINRPNGDD